MKKIGTVYRLENIDKDGPYVTLGDYWQSCEHCSETGRPGPIVDFGKGWSTTAYKQCKSNERYCFGFSSIKQYWNWFDKKERRILYSNGFYLVKIENVTIIFESIFQTIFAYNRDRHKGLVIYGKY